MKAAIYCRVSTEDQEKEGTSLQTQLEACRNYCQDKGYDTAYRFSEAYSGLTLERPKLDELRELGRNEQINVVVVYCLDRLSRDPTQGVILTQELEKHRVILEAVTETVDSSELGKLISYIRGFASKLEAERIKERTTRGKKARLAEGKLPQGTGVGIYGYDWNKETKRREVNLYEAAIVSEIFNRVASGEKLLPIGRNLNQRGVPTKGTIVSKNPADRKLWHTLTIRRMIRNPAYTGNTHFGDTLLPHVTPATISEDVFNAANAQLNKPKIRTGQPKHEYLLRNHAFCAICGRPLVGHCLNKKYLYYQCSSARPYENSKQICRARYIRASNLEDVVWSKTREVLSNPSIVLAEIQQQIIEANAKTSVASVEAEIGQLEKNLRKYEQRRSNLLEALELGEFEKDEVLDRLNNLKSLRDEDEIKLNDLQKTKENLTSLADAKIKLGQLYHRVTANLENADLELKRLALNALDIKVYASTDYIEVQGVIPLELPTTAQTSALTFNCRYSYIEGKGYALSRAYSQ